MTKTISFLNYSYNSHMFYNSSFSQSSFVLELKLIKPKVFFWFNNFINFKKVVYWLSFTKIGP